MIKSCSISSSEYYIETNKTTLVGYGNIRLDVNLYSGIFDSPKRPPNLYGSEWANEFYGMFMEINSNVPGTLHITLSRLGESQYSYPIDDELGLAFGDTFDCEYLNLVPVYSVYIYSNVSH